MLKFINYNIVFQEIPNETTLAINLSGCPNGCIGCHSSDLKQDIGEVLDVSIMQTLIEKYRHSVTCISFMGGDAHPTLVEKLAITIRTSAARQIKTAWYSGKSKVPDNVTIESFDFIKLGPYIEKLGALDSADTNQRFFKIIDGQMIDHTYLFRKAEIHTAV